MRKSILLLFVLLMLSAAAVRAYNPYPVAIIHAPSNIYVGEQVEFDGSYSYDSFGPLIWYVWSVNGVQKQAGSDAAMFYHSFSLPPGFAEEQVQVELCVYNTFPYEDCTSVMRTVKQKPGHYYYLTDHLGSVRATVNATGQLVGWDDYYPFGGQMPGRSMNMANPNDLYKFTGHERDTEAGLMLDFMNARNYDPEMGRFLQRDPLASQYPGFSPYVYVFNNPVRYFDPTGMWVAEYDEEGNVVMVHYEEGDTFESLYTQLGLTAETFAEQFGVDLSMGPAGMSFNITDLVLNNTDFVSSFEGSNCHGFVCTVSGAMSQETMVAGQELFSTLGNVTATSTPQTGDIAVFTQTGVFGIPGQTTDLTGVPAHSGLFIVSNQAGEAQFLNRLNTGHPVTVNTNSQIANHFQGVVSRGTSAGIVMPQFNSNPRFYRR